MSTERTGLLHPAFSGFSSKRRIAFLLFSGDASPVLAKSQYFIWFPFQSAQVHSYSLIKRVTVRIQYLTPLPFLSSLPPYLLTPPPPHKNS